MLRFGREQRPIEKHMSYLPGAPARHKKDIDVMIKSSPRRSGPIEFCSKYKSNLILPKRQINAI
jgi:hypothetical protein